MRISDWSSDVCSSDLLYANISKGYKGGTFPVQGAVIEQQYRPVTQESVLAYEIGLKTDLFDGRAHLNLAAFYYDYKDKQVIGRALFPPFGPQGVLVNVPKSRIFGIDRSEEHTSELQSLMRISYAVFCLKKKKPTKT